MWNFTTAVRMAVDNQNWYAALCLALLLPDICGRLVDPRAKSQARYRSWYDVWLAPTYTVDHRDGPEVLLTGDDCYALRCAISHEGRDNISEQKAKSILNSFKFNAPHPNFSMHCNIVNDALQLQVDIFARDICNAVEKWLAAVAEDKDIQLRMDELMTIHDTSEGIPGFLSVNG